MTPRRQSTRRDFLKTSSTIAAGTALAGGLSLSRSAHAAGSDVIKLALIGAGGRGKGAAGQLMTADPNLKLVAVADAFEDNAVGAVEMFRKNKKYASQIDVPPERIFSGFDAYKQAIATDADLVVLATSPGFRPIHYAAAVAANKHVFMEKPCCVDAPGYRLLMETNKLADEKGLLVGVGLQRRHQPNYMETIKRIHDGAIGDLMVLRAYWNGGGVWTRARKPQQTEMEYQMRNWYYFVWLCGDHICEQHVHNLDIVNWVKGGHPVEANGMGGREVRKGIDNGQIFDHHFIEFTYDDGTKMYSQCRHIKGAWRNVSEGVHGTKGTSNCAGKIEGEKEWTFAGAKVKGHQQEQTDLVAALRAGKRYNEGYYGATSSFTAVLGRMATYSGKIVKWDDAVEKGPAEMPYGEDLTYDSQPPVVPDDKGKYPVAVPGVYKAY
jgi:myo-inositol 2-dehydrogenase/D-chiro-inositol 1-dehydrogenase